MAKKNSVRLLIQRTGLTISAFADEISVTRQTVHAWIRAGEIPEMQMYRLRAIKPGWFD